MFPDLTQEKNILIKQRHELAELIGFETRNKYEILSESGASVAFAAEQGKGFFNLLLRGFLGHWRTFEIHFFGNNRNKIMTAKHPFRWYFSRLEIFDGDGQKIGILEKRFSIFTKKFDVLTADERPSMTVSSPIWKIWTFPFLRNGNEIAFVRKKWSGLFSEIGTDRDNFMVEYTSPNLSQKERQILLAAGVFIDLMYFEKKANN